MRRTPGDDLLDEWRDTTYTDARDLSERQAGAVYPSWRDAGKRTRYARRDESEKPRNPCDLCGKPSKPHRALCPACCNRHRKALKMGLVTPRKAGRRTKKYGRCRTCGSTKLYRSGFCQTHYLAYRSALSRQSRLEQKAMEHEPV